MLRAVTVIWVLGLALNVFASAQPQNILLDGYIFARAENWEWQAPKDPTTLNLFLIRDSAGNIRGDIKFFYLKEGEELRKRVVNNFEEGAEVKESVVHVGGTKVTYVTVIGTAAARGKDAAKPNYQLVATILVGEETGKTFLTRLYGPRPEVEAALKGFKHMVEGAIAETTE